MWDFLDFFAILLPIPEMIFGWWLGLHWSLRLPLALAVVVVGGCLCLVEWYILGGTFVVLGIVLIIFSFPNRAEQKGYHDF